MSHQLPKHVQRCFRVKQLHLMWSPPLFFCVPGLVFPHLAMSLCDTFLFVSSFKHYHHHFLLPCSLHLFPGPGQRLVWEPGPVFTLEREEEAELPQLWRRVLKPAGLVTFGSSLNVLCANVEGFCFIWGQGRMRVTKLHSKKARHINNAAILMFERDPHCHRWGRDVKNIWTEKHVQK